VLDNQASTRGDSAMKAAMRIWALRDVAKALDLTPSRVQQLADQGKLPATRDTGRRRVFFEDDVLHFKAEREKQRAAG